MKIQLGLIAFTAVLLLSPSIVHGATIRAGIDGIFVDVPTFVLSAAEGETSRLGCGKPLFIYRIAGVWQAEMRGELEPRPVYLLRLGGD